MKFRQHIRVFGYPDALKTRVVFKRTTCLIVDGFGEIDIHSKQKVERFKQLLDKCNIKYTPANAKERIRIRYLGLDKGIDKAIRGRLYKGDLLYTIEANDERELLDKRDEILQELKTLKVPYEDVCKWVCETAPMVPAKKMFTPKKPKENINKTLDEISQDHKKLKNTVEDLKDKLREAESVQMKKAAIEDRRARAGVLQ